MAQLEDEIAMVDLNKTIDALSHAIDGEDLTQTDEEVLISLRHILLDTLRQVSFASAEH